MGVNQQPSPPATKTGNISRTFNYVVGVLDRRVVSPETRRRTYSTILTFSQDNPILTSFITTHLLLSSLPLLLFASFTFSVLALALVSAIVFSFFWIGVALLILVPTLFVTIGAGCFLFAWGLVWVVGARWAYGVVFGEAKSRALVPVKVERTGDVVWGNGTKGERVGLGKGEVREVVREVGLEFEDVDCRGMMGGGMELN